jgi:tetratricopeptide (TPR) repeat protein
MKKLACLLIASTGLWFNLSLNGQNQADAASAMMQLVVDKNFTEAIALGKELLPADSMNPQIHYCLGLAYGNLKQYRYACKSLEKANELRPGTKSLILNLADAYCEVADVAAAEILVRDLLKTDSSDLSVWIELAQVFQRGAKNDEAMSIYLRLWQADSTNIWYPRQIGQMLARSERYKEAVPFLKAVVDEDSTDQNSYLRLAQAFLYLKDTTGIPVLDKALRQDSMQPLLYRYRGGLYFGAGVFSRAFTDLAKALELGDTTAFTCRHLGISQFQLSKYADAVVTLNKSITLDSLDTEAWYYLGYSYKWTEDLPKGIECMERALKVAVPPFVANIYSGLGLFHQLKNGYKASMTYYEKAAEFNPADPVPYAQLGVLVELTAGKKELAKAYYERFLKEYTGNDRSLVTYTRYRLQMINEKLFMEGKIKK